MSDNFQVCDHNHPQVVYRVPPYVVFPAPGCPWCADRRQLDDALDQIANLEFQVAALEEKLRILEERP